METIHPTAETIRIARDAAQENELKYTVEVHDTAEGFFWVQREGELARLVGPNPFADGHEGECTCPDFKDKGFCPCIAALELWRQEAEDESNREAAAFMDFVARDHAAANLIAYNTDDLL